MISVQALVRTLAALLLVGSLGACASGAQSVNMVATGVQPVAANSALASSISIDSVVGGKNTNPLWTSQISNGDFEAALRDSLIAAGLYESIGDYKLEARLISVQQPLIGIALTVTTTVEYTLRRADGTQVFNETIVSPYTAQFSEAAIAMIRLRLANEGSARENISQVIDRLQTESLRLQSAPATS